MAGLTKPRWRPAYWSARAIIPAHSGALALVPPLLRIVDLAAALADDQRHAGVASGVGGHVRYAPGGADAGHAVLVAGPREHAAESAARGLEGRSRVSEREAPRGLADIGARLVAGGQGRAAGGEHERVGGGQVGLLDRGNVPPVKALINGTARPPRRCRRRRRPRSRDGWRPPAAPRAAGPPAARVSQCSPPVWPAALIEMTPPWVRPSRSAATAAVTALAVLFRAVVLTRTTAMAASGRDHVHHLDVEYLLAVGQPGRRPRRPVWSRPAAARRAGRTACRTAPGPGGCR